MTTTSKDDLANLLFQSLDRQLTEEETTRAETLGKSLSGDDLWNIYLQLTNKFYSSENSDNPLDYVNRVSMKLADVFYDVYRKYVGMPITRDTLTALGNRVKLSDEDKEAGLELYCYVKCDNSDNELLQRCRGIVFHGDEVILQSFPYTVEMNNTEVDRINDLFSTDLTKFSFYDSHEGALIRVFNYSGKWYVSTHRKLNAFRSKWSSYDSFGVIFGESLYSEAQNNPELHTALGDYSRESILPQFFRLLNPEKQYMFLVRNTKDNRIVCSPPERPMLYHVGTFVNKRLVLEETLPVPYPKALPITSVDELMEYVASVDIYKLQGVIVFSDDNKQYKIMNSMYQHLFNVRGNEPSVKFRYLQIRMNRKMTDMLYSLYPENAHLFDEYENNLYDIARFIYDSYVNRYIHKNFVSVPKEEYSIMNECHSWHIQDRKTNKVKLEKVLEVMNTRSAVVLNRMIRRLMESRNSTEEESTD